MHSRSKNKVQTSTQVRGRGRPRGFDADLAVLAAEQTFLRQGYAATTVDDLSKAMGINRPSLYAAFEGKEALYQRALDVYATRMQTLFECALDEPVFAKALRQLYATALDAYVLEDGEAVGCMVACTAVTEAASNHEIKSRTKSIMDEIDLLVSRRISRAIAEGELPRSMDAKALSRLAVGVLHTLAMRSSRRILDQIAADSVALLTQSAARR
jgi:AcrR family transcriptional regulator